MLKFSQSCINQEVLTKSIRVYLNVCTRIFFGRPSGWELAGNSAHADGTAADRLCWRLRSTESDCVPLHSAGCSAGCSADSGGTGAPNHQTQPSMDLENLGKVTPEMIHQSGAFQKALRSHAPRHPKQFREGHSMLMVADVADVDGNCVDIDGQCMSYLYSFSAFYFFCSQHPRPLCRGRFAEICD